MVQEATNILNPIQSKHQFGFSPGCSPIFAALILTEVINEAKDSGEQLYITLMDTSKAFDVVNHAVMLNSISEARNKGYSLAAV